jgi:phytoene/squalene synthetase
MKSEEYQIHLNRVSRSFALSLTALEEPLREYVSLTYLLCRLIDTVEDSPWPDFASQKRQLDELSIFLKVSPSISEVRIWQSKMPKEIPDGEKKLVSEAKILIDDFHRLPSAVFEIIQKRVLTMIAGMTEVLSKKDKNILKLTSASELDQYCYYVAGVVGEILTDLVYWLAHGKKGSAKAIEQSVHFGLFLQKVNILKDRQEDASRGIAYFQDTNEVLESLSDHATQAREYIVSLPKEMISYRLFCTFSLSLGLMSLPVILSDTMEKPKLNRSETIQLWEELKALTLDLEKLNAFFNFWIAQLPNSIKP